MLFSTKSLFTISTLLTAVLANYNGTTDGHKNQHWNETKTVETHVKFVTVVISKAVATTCVTTGTESGYPEGGSATSIPASSLSESGSLSIGSSYSVSTYPGSESYSYSVSESGSVTSSLPTNGPSSYSVSSSKTYVWGNSSTISTSSSSSTPYNVSSSATSSSKGTETGSLTSYSNYSVSKSSISLDPSSTLLSITSKSSSSGEIYIVSQLSSVISTSSVSEPSPASSQLSPTSTMSYTKSGSSSVLKSNIVSSSSSSSLSRPVLSSSSFVSQTSSKLSSALSSSSLSISISRSSRSSQASSSSGSWTTSKSSSTLSSSISTQSGTSSLSSSVSKSSTSNQSSPPSLSQTSSKTSATLSSSSSSQPISSSTKSSSSSLTSSSVSKSISSSSSSLSSTTETTSSSTSLTSTSKSSSYSSSSSSKSSISSTSSKSSTSISSSKTSSSSSTTSSSSKNSTSSKTLSTSSSSTSSATSSATSSPTTCSGYWMESIKHQGIAPFNAAPGTYQVFRNVKDFGAKGDGVTDDTVAINNAISSGNRCAPGSCGSSTTTPAIVYFPNGTYIVSNPGIIDYYYTQIIGNPIPGCMPTIKAASSTTVRWLIDGDQYGANGLGYGATNVFWRQIRNFIIDLRAIPASFQIAAVHWPTAQATSLQNMVFQMSQASGTQHQGLFIEGGSGGFINDLIFNGGAQGLFLANQQFTMRNLTFNNAVTAIQQGFDWSWTYKGISINNCQVGIDMSAASSSVQSVGAIVVIDSDITNTPVGISTIHTLTNNSPDTGGCLILENVRVKNVPTVVQGTGNSVLLAGSAGSTTIPAWGQGHRYSPALSNFQGPFTPTARVPGLLSGTNYYSRSKPQYENLPASAFLSVRTAGATGNGKTDDSAALQAVLYKAASTGQVVYFDSGDYLVTTTIYFPPGVKVNGEAYPVILSSGSYFANISNPKPVVQVGKAGDTGSIEWSDMIVSTQGAQAGAILIEWNLASTVAGMWDVHTRIGGFAGSNLQLADCPVTNATTITAANVPKQCIAAFMSMHVTSSAAGLYMENCWLWVADHDVEDTTLRQITVYAGRGLLIESSEGNNWLYGTAVEHHSLYQYSLVNTGDLFMGFIQTETAYYQPNPDATVPFPINAAYSDSTYAAGQSGWGLHVSQSHNVTVYGQGLYSFFSNNDVHCSDQGNGETCQSKIFSVDTYSAASIAVYGYSTVGTTNMINLGGTDIALYSDNLDGFVDTIAIFREY